VQRFSLDVSPVEGRRCYSAGSRQNGCPASFIVQSFYRKFLGTSFFFNWSIISVLPGQGATQATDNPLYAAVIKEETGEVNYGVKWFFPLIFCFIISHLPLSLWEKKTFSVTLKWKLLCNAFLCDNGVGRRKEAGRGCELPHCSSCFLPFRGSSPLFTLVLEVFGNIVNTVSCVIPMFWSRGKGGAIVDFRRGLFCSSSNFLPFVEVLPYIDLVLLLSI